MPEYRIFYAHFIAKLSTKGRKPTKLLSSTVKVQLKFHIANNQTKPKRLADIDSNIKR